MTSPVEFTQPERAHDLAYTVDEKIITLGLLIKDAHEADDHELAEIYREQLDRLHREQDGNTQQVRKPEVFSKIIDTAKRARFGAGVLTVICVIAGAAVARGEQLANEEELKRTTAIHGAADDGFEVVSYKEREYYPDELTLAPTENCTVTTTNWDFDEDTRDVLTYTFDVTDGQVEVRTAEELVERYGDELCQIMD